MLIARNRIPKISPRLAFSVAVLAALPAGGCSTILAVKEQQALADASAVVSGTVAMADGQAHGPIVVGLVTKGPDGFRLIDHFVAEKPGPWIFATQAGTYWIAAFEDTNGNGRYDGEPAYRPSPDHPVTLTPGQKVSDMTIAIPRDGVFASVGFAIADLEARAAKEQQVHSIYGLSVSGVVTSLDDPRFSERIASSGMWKPWDFLLHTEPGIYFLEPYDPSRIPVLFVHGIGGTPLNFRELIAGLDRKRYQAWVAYYPSGGNLGVIGDWMAQMFARLRTKHRFPKAAVVAHSMGGLVTRRFLLGDFDRTGSDVVRTTVTISSPLGGMVSAGKGVEDSPVVVRSWYGLAPGSDFLDGLFYSDVPKRQARRRLPAHMAYHMMFGFHGRDASDGVVALSSQLRPEAQEEARSLRGFDETHTGILRSPATSARLNAILAEMP
jgi:pimeloyl-ACP methyl ester carboxylesterase